MKGRIQLMANKDTQHFIKLAAYKEIGIKEAMIQSDLQKPRFYNLIRIQDQIVWETNETIKNQEPIQILITPKQKSHWNK